MLAGGADHEALQVSALAQTPLLLVNGLCDLAEIPTGGIGVGTTVRLHVRLR